MIFFFFKGDRRMKRKKIEIKKLGINGEGIGYIDRKITFVKGAMVGEIVEVEITKTTKSFYEAKLLKVIKHSFDRQQVICQKQEQCQGCTLLHMPYLQQLQFKKEAIYESLKKYTNYDLKKIDFPDVIASDTLEGFINTVNLPVVKLKDRITFGIYQRETKYLVLLHSCFKYHPYIKECLMQLEEILNQNKVKVYDDRQKIGLRFLKVKCIDDQIQLVFITGKDGLKEEVLKQIQALLYVKGIFVSVNTTRYQDFEQSGYRKISGYTRLTLHHENKEYQLSIKSKLPENIEMMWKKHKIIIELLKDAKRILSINSGNGLLELNIDEKEVVCLDDKKYHQEDGKLNAKYLNRNNITFLCGNIDELVESNAKKKVFDAFIIQTERLGLSNKIKESIILSKVKHVIYCCENHSTLAKDLAELEKYYKIEKIVALDTHVYTPYVTTIVKLKRK